MVRVVVVAGKTKKRRFDSRTYPEKISIVHST